MCDYGREVRFDRIQSKVTVILLPGSGKYKEKRFSLGFDLFHFREECHGGHLRINYEINRKDRKTTMDSIKTPKVWFLFNENSLFCIDGMVNYW